MNGCEIDVRHVENETELFSEEPDSPVGIIMSFLFFFRYITSKRATYEAGKNPTLPSTGVEAARATLQPKFAASLDL